MPFCSILGCKNDSRRKNLKNGGVSYHRFPKDGSVKEKWINATGRVNWMPSKSSTMCSDHFLEVDFFASIKGYRYMKATAYPSMKIVKFFNESGRTDEESSVSLPAEDDDEIKVFCPKCNTQVSHTAEGIQNDQTKIIIAKVYHYFEQEYEELKKTYEGLQLTPLSKFGQRTALATGVSESTVHEILQEEERRNAEEIAAQLRVRRKARKRSRQTDSSSEEDSLESNDEDEDGEQSSTEHVTETLVVKEEPPETLNEEPEIYTGLLDVKDEPESAANEELADPLVADVKTEPRHEEATNSNMTHAVQPAFKRYKGSTSAPPGSSAPPDSSAPPGPSAPPSTSALPGPSAPPTTRRRELLLLEDGQVKLEDKEIDEEGFS